MASAYRSALRAGDISDSDESMSDAINSSSGTADENSSEDEESEETGKITQTIANGNSTENTEIRNRILMLTSRGVSFRHRHLLADLHSLLPHTYKDTKLDTKSNNNYNSALNALADLHSCNYVFFFEGRKHGQDLYLWLAKAPNGPTIKFSVDNVHTMGELGFGGNCLKGGRGIVVFDKSFDGEIGGGGEYKALMREMFKGVFCVPSKGVRGMKPFVDRVVGIYGLDGKVWIRVYEIREGDKTNTAALDAQQQQQQQLGGGSDVSLVEVGPRLVLTPIVILEGSFGGPVIYENKQYVSPNQVRAEARVRKSGTYAKRRVGMDERKVKKQSLGLRSGEKRNKSDLDNSVLFG